MDTLRGTRFFTIDASAAIPLVSAPIASADGIAYLVDVHVRPGYSFQNAEATLVYGHSVCDRITAGVPDAHLMNQLKSELKTADDHLSNYLIGQATNKLCPDSILALRQSAGRR